MEVNFKIDNFKAAGDKGKGVPRTTLSEVKVRLRLVVHILLYYDVDKKLWCCDGGENFRMELLKFRGPFGTFPPSISTPSGVNLTPLSLPLYIAPELCIDYLSIA